MSLILRQPRTTTARQQALAALLQQHRQPICGCWHANSFEGVVEYSLGKALWDPLLGADTSCLALWRNLKKKTPVPCIIAQKRVGDHFPSFFFLFLIRLGVQHPLLWKNTLWGQPALSRGSREKQITNSLCISHGRWTPWILSRYVSS